MPSPRAELILLNQSWKVLYLIFYFLTFIVVLFSFCHQHQSSFGSHYARHLMKT